ncbi:PAS domain S-box protein [Neobacillus niacini]|uniref:PAS domain-containing sensor histidine kinase n=1 Tax=Neobacillus niacini TaxID=86668 RepID=UPI002FFDE982
MAKCYPIFGSEDAADLFNPDEMLDLFLRCTVDAICIINMENRFIRINQIYSRIFGYTEEDVIGRRYEELPIPDHLDDIIVQVKNGQNFPNLITQSYHRDGHMVDIAVSYSPLRNSSGEIIAILGIYRDITKEISMERELKRTRELYKLITENASDLIKVYSKDYKIVYASPSHEKVTGYTPEQLLGLHVCDVIQSEEQDTLKSMARKLLETGESQLIQITMKTKDNKVLYFETTVSPVYNEKMEADSYVTVSRNITDRVENDAALRNLDRLSIIGQLAAGVAHEIRNPLTSLKGFSKLLKSATPIEKQSEYLAIISEELDRIDMIVNEFMSLAKPQANQFERGNLISILDSTVNVLRPQAMLDNVQVSINYPKDYPKEDHFDLLCSPNQLKQVFVNILKNAIESMPKGGNVTISIRKLKNKRVVITFKDEGPGIESELLKCLGTPFYTTKDKGIGLGLTVSNKIVQEHNGMMKIESQQGEGTTVNIELEYI